MPSFLFRIGTLALLFASLAPASVSHRYARSEPRDQGRATYRPTVDHIVPLKRSGADAPENMQWQTVQDAKAKDRTE